MKGTAIVEREGWGKGEKRVSVTENGFAYWQSIGLLVTATSPI
jgi:hypothetical protein